MLSLEGSCSFLPMVARPLVADHTTDFLRRCGESDQRSPTPHCTSGGQRTLPLLSIVCQVSIALCQSNRLRLICSGVQGGIHNEVRTQNNTLCNRTNEF